MSTDKNTKQLILEKALDLFSQKGFQAVSTREIAEAVGVQKGALYNHFKNKQDIFDSIIILVEEHTKQMNTDFSFPGLSGENTTLCLKQLSKDNLLELSCKMFESYIRDEMIMKFRRMYMIEQYTCEDIRRKYQMYFIDAMIEKIAAMNQQLMDMGIYKKSDPKELAVWYFAPTFLLMNRYDGDEADIEQASTLLRGCLSHFMDEVLIQG